MQVGTLRPRAVKAAWLAVRDSACTLGHLDPSAWGPSRLGPVEPEAPESGPDLTLTLGGDLPSWGPGPVNHRGSSGRHFNPLATLTPLLVLGLSHGVVVPQLTWSGRGGVVPRGPGTRSAHGYQDRGLGRGRWGWAAEAAHLTLGPSPGPGLLWAPWGGEGAPCPSPDRPYLPPRPSTMGRSASGRPRSASRWSSTPALPICGSRLSTANCWTSPAVSQPVPCLSLVARGRPRAGPSPCLPWTWEGRGPGEGHAALHPSPA